MKRFKTLETDEEKAEFIISRMDMLPLDFSTDDVLMWECVINTRVFMVEIMQRFLFNGCLTEDTTITHIPHRHEAEICFDDYVEDMRLLSNDVYGDNATVSLYYNQLSFKTVLRSDELDVITMADLFDRYIYKNSVLIDRAVLSEQGEIITNNQLTKKES